MTNLLRWGCLALCLAFMGCHERPDLDAVQKEVFRLVRAGHTDSTAAALALTEKTLAQQPSVRTWNDSLAYADSLDIAYLHRVRVAMLYDNVQEAAPGMPDTVRAALAFIEAIPWTNVWRPRGKVQFWAKYSEVASEAMVIAQSTNMANLAYQGFQQAELLALTYEDVHDEGFLELVGDTRNDFLHTIQAMPDSVRLAFAPSSNSSSAPLPIGLIAFIGFIALGTGAGGVHLWAKRRQSHASQDATDADTHSFVPYDVRYADWGSAERCLEALWVLSFAYNEVPEEALQIVTDKCRSLDHQRALFMAAGLMVSGLDYDPLKAAGLVRQRLLRYAKRNKIAFHPGVLLPRDRAEMRQWLDHLFGTKRPVQVLGSREDRDTGADQKF